jgi:HAD superfamily hydrolase (TIGR01484 family)
MSEIKLVLTDLDGTVADIGKHVVSENVRDAIVSCEDRGVHVVPVTGRFYDMAKPVLEVLGFDDLGVFDNGATIQDCKTGDVVWSQWMEVDVVKRLARTLIPVSRIIDYAREGDEHEPADNELERIDLIDQAVASVFAIVHQDDIEATTRQLEQVPDVTFYWAPVSYVGGPVYKGVQITHILADKFHGVNALRNIIGTPKEQTLAIGDGDNDIALFNNAGIKVAMGNATEKLQAAADYIVGPVEQDGFAEAMGRFVLAQ